MSKFTVAALNESRAELKQIITAVLPQFPSIERVHFSIPAIAGGMFEPTQLLVLKSIPKFSYKMDVPGELTEADRRLVTIQVGLETTPSAPPMAMTDQLPHHHAMAQNNLIHTQPRSTLVDLFTFMVNNQEFDDETIEKVIDAIFIGLVAQLGGGGLLRIMGAEIKGLEYTMTPLAASVYIRHEDKVLYQYSTLVNGAHFNGAMIQAVATALVMIPDNHGIVFQTLSGQAVIFGNGIL
jgi:hypothetical protein